MGIRHRWWHASYNTAGRQNGSLHGDRQRSGLRHAPCWRRHHWRGSLKRRQADDLRPLSSTACLCSLDPPPMTVIFRPNVIRLRGRHRQCLPHSRLSAGPRSTHNAPHRQPHYSVLSIQCRRYGASSKSRPSSHGAIAARRKATCSGSAAFTTARAMTFRCSVVSWRSVLVPNRARLSASP